MMEEGKKINFYRLGLENGRRYRMELTDEYRLTGTGGGVFLYLAPVYDSRDLDGSWHRLVLEGDFYPIIDDLTAKPMLLFIRLGRADGKCLVLHGRIHFVSNGQGEIILDHFHFNHNFRIFDFSGCFDRIVQKIRNKRTEMMIGDRQMRLLYSLVICHTI